MSRQSYIFEHCGQISSTSALIPELKDKDERDQTYHIWPNHYERELFTCHSHPDDWLRVKEGSHSDLSGRLYPKVPTIGMPSWGHLTNLSQPKRRFTDINNPFCVTALAFSMEFMFIGTHSGILRRFELETLEPSGDDLKMDSPIFEIYTGCSDSHLIIRAGRDLFDFNNIEKSLSIVTGYSEEYFIAILANTCLGNFVLSQEGNLYSMKIKTGTNNNFVSIRYKKGLVKNVLRASYVNLEQMTEEEPDKGFLLGITCCSEVVLIRVYNKILTSEELEWRTPRLSFEVLVRLDASLYAGGVRLVLLQNRILLTYRISFPR